MNRLREYERGTLAENETTKAIYVSSDITLPGTDTERTYDLDGLGNWRRAGYTPVGGNATTEVRQHNAANQVTKFGTTDVDYDGAYARAVMDLDPAGYWRLGDSSGTSAADQTGDNDGTYTGTGGTNYKLNETGALANDGDTAAWFDGSAGYVNVPHAAAPELDITGDVTMTAWVNVDTFPTGGAYQAILGKGSNATDIAYWLALRENSGSCYLIAGAGASNEIASWAVDTTDVWPTGKWVHVAATSDGTDWKLYFNGRQVDQTASATGATSTSAAFRVAAFDNNGTPGNYLAATIDEAAVFDSVLSGAQIEQLYRIGAGSLAGQAGNGNITDDGTRLYAYDAFNRVIQVRGKSDGLLVATYTYDALGRRIRKVIANTGLPGTLSNDTIDYLYNGVQCVEERDGSDNEIRQYVWGRYVDELIQQREINGGSDDYFMLSDLLYRASVLVEDDGSTIEETYDCDAYGNTQALTSGTTRTYNPTCQFIFTGRRFDPETSDSDSQMYFYRARYYSPVLGRFISRDPIGYADSMNLYEYVGGMAVGAVDPEGLLLANIAAWWVDGGKAERRDRRRKNLLIAKIKQHQAAALKAYRAGCIQKGDEESQFARNLMKLLPGLTADVRDASKKILDAAKKGANQGLEHGWTMTKGSYMFWDEEAKACKRAVVDRYGYDAVGAISDVGAAAAYAAGVLTVAGAAAPAMKTAPGALTIPTGTVGSAVETGAIVIAEDIGYLTLGTVYVAGTQVVAPLAQWSANTPQGQYVVGFGRGFYSGYTSNSAPEELPLTPAAGAGQTHGEFVGTLLSGTGLLEQ